MIYKVEVKGVHSRIFLSDVRSRTDIVGVVMDVSCMTNCPAKHYQQPRQAVKRRQCTLICAGHCVTNPCSSLALRSHLGAFPEIASRNPQNVY